MNDLKQAVILCGGLGTRLHPYTNRMPKPMIPCNGKPFLWYLLQQLNEQGVKRFVLLTGYLAEQIEGYFGDGSKWGWNIVYSQGPVEWDTGRRLWEAHSLLELRFLLLYSDNFVPFPLAKVLRQHEQHGLPLTFMIAGKSPGNISVDQHGIVQEYDNTRTGKGCDYVEIGYMIVERDQVFEFYEKPECSFSSILQRMAARHKISAWIQHDEYHSISDPERWKRVESYLLPKNILLIDRDGVINRKAPRGEYVSTWDEFEWIVDTRHALKILAEDGFQFIVISNQAGIARSMVVPDELEKIHKNMIEDLKNDGVTIMDIYVCPHHWDEECFCRKPKPGMLLQASREHLIRLDKTIFIGDDSRDCQCAFTAGCNSIFMGAKEDFHEQQTSDQPLFYTQSLLDVVDKIKDFYKEENIL